jgi:hypothetical protein
MSWKLLLWKISNALLKHLLVNTLDDPLSHVLTNRFKFSLLLQPTVSIRFLSLKSLFNTTIPTLIYNLYLFLYLPILFGPS